MSNPLLSTKLYIPPTRPDLVPRKRLIEQLNAGLAGRITLISAPAGFGKTSILSAWLQEHSNSAAWLSLDSEDNDHSRFWQYLIAAIQALHPSVGEGVKASLQMSQPPPMDTLLTIFINDLSAIPSPLILVLDDYHLIREESIHHNLDYFIDHLPARIHLVIATRENPPLALSRWRARAELTEIRVADLRFTKEETSEFLNTISNLDLNDDDVAALEKRTEGWAVGLHLAALSLQALDARGKQEFIDAFAGDDRYVMDYLVEEILQYQPPHIQDFLYQTSILERMCGPLCDALTDRDDSQKILDKLERINLFTIPLDNRRFWFRYHHLFADLLYHRLSLSTNEADIRSIRIRASRWFEREGLINEAIKYALATQDFNYTAEIINRHVLSTFYRSETVLVYKWLKSLPEEVLHSHALLSAVFASCILLEHLNTLDTPESAGLVKKWLKIAETSLEAEATSQKPRTASFPVARHYIDKVRAYLLQLRLEDPQKVIDFTLESIARLPEDENLFRSALAYNLGNGYSRLGDLDSARKSFEEAWHTGIASNDLFNASAGINALADIARAQGQLQQAVEICRTGLQTIKDKVDDRLIPYTGTIEIVLGEALLEQGQLEDAVQNIQNGLAKLELTSAPSHQSRGLIVLASIQQIQGQIEEALESLAKAEQLRPQDKVHASTQRVKLWLRQAPTEPHYLDLALHWAEDHRELLDADCEEIDLETLTLARVILAQHQRNLSQPFASLKQLQAILMSHDAIAEQHNDLPSQIEIQIIQALTQQARGNQQRAIEVLEQALVMAAPQKFSFIFIGEGEPVLELLRQAKPSSNYPEFIDRLCSISEKWRLGENAQQKQKSAQDQLIEPLRPRELEILKLIATGISNPEISEKLYISVNTVKTHITHIFRKLDVSRRTQAVARARELGILE
jgi:LuxR family maltose regulon positive regulatory protein